VLRLVLAGKPFAVVGLFICVYISAHCCRPLGHSFTFLPFRAALQRRAPARRYWQILSLFLPST
jgi:hypothetical protein